MFVEKRLSLLIMLVVTTLLAACGGTSPPPAPTTTGDPVAGEALFNQIVIGNTAGCVNCHSLEPGVDLVGPSLHGIGTTAETRIASYTAEQYLRESIISVDAYIVPGFQAGYMYPSYGVDLTPTQIDDLVAYMLTLK